MSESSGKQSDGDSELIARVRAAARQEQFLDVVSAEEARARFERHLDLSPLAAETVSLSAALTRVLAHGIVAAVDAPPFDRSNVDGFALRAADTLGANNAAPKRLRLNPEVIACGDAPELEVAAGTATTIATGGMIPRGADAVVMVEQTDLIETGAPKIELRRAAAPGQFISYAGSDIARGETLLRRGTRIGSREIGMLAACGLANVDVVRKPKVAVIDSSVPNAFATGRNPKNALVAVTTGIRQRLTDRGLEGVLGHELAHVRNKDMRVLAIANFLVTMTSFVMSMLFWSALFGGGKRDRQGGANAMMLLYLITMVVYFVGQLLVLALTRYREYGADHSGAEISGDPGALATALEKISGAMARIPSEDLRKLQTASAFLFIPAALKGDNVIQLFSTHPPVEDRIRRLRELEQRARFGMR